MGLDMYLEEVMKVYTITLESEDDGWACTLVFASRAAASKHINAAITEFNDEEGTTYKHIIWPDRVRDTWFKVGRYRYICQEEDLVE